MKPLPPTPIASGERRHCDREDGDLPEGALHPVAIAAPLHDVAAGAADADAEEHAVADLLGGEHTPRRRARELGVAGGEREEHRNRRERDAVVQAALHVERLPHPDGHILARHDRLTEGGIGRGEDRGDECGDRRGKIEDPRREQRPERDRERKSEREHARGEREVGAQALEVDPHRVGEQEETQGDLGEHLDATVVERDLDDAEPG